jgi:hypothetical protein
MKPLWGYIQKYNGSMLSITIFNEILLMVFNLKYMYRANNDSSFLFDIILHFKDNLRLLSQIKRFFQFRNVDLLVFKYSLILFRIVVVFTIMSYLIVSFKDPGYITNSSIRGDFNEDIIFTKKNCKKNYWLPMSLYSNNEKHIRQELD